MKFLSPRTRKKIGIVHCFAVEILVYTLMDQTDRDLKFQRRLII